MLILILLYILIPVKSGNSYTLVGNWPSQFKSCIYHEPSSVLKIHKLEKQSDETYYYHEAVWERRRFFSMAAGVFEPIDEEIKERYGRGYYIGFSMWEMITGNLGGRMSLGYSYQSHHHVTVNRFLKSGSVTHLWGDFAIGEISVALEAILRAKISQRAFIFCGPGIGLCFVRESITAGAFDSLNQGWYIVADGRNEKTGFSFSAGIQYWRIICEANLSSYQVEKFPEYLRSAVNLGGVRFTAGVCF